jgi:hypothetical protein
MPTSAELNQLETAILEHVIPRKGRKQCVIKFLFAELRRRPKQKTISAKEVLEVCKPKKGTKDKGTGALRRVKADLKKRLDSFFAEKGQSLPYRVTFEGEGNYMPIFLPIKVADFTPLFWGPYLESDHTTRSLLK